MMMDQEKRTHQRKLVFKRLSLKRRVRSKVDVLKELCGVKVSECSSKSKSAITEDAHGIQVTSKPIAEVRPEG